MKKALQRHRLNKQYGSNYSDSSRGSRISRGLLQPMLSNDALNQIVADVENRSDNSSQKSSSSLRKVGLKEKRNKSFGNLMELVHPEEKIDKADKLIVKNNTSKLLSKNVLKRKSYNIGTASPTNLSIPRVNQENTN